MNLEITATVGASDYDFIVTHFDGGSPATFKEPASMPEMSYELADPELLGELEAEDGYCEESLWQRLFDKAEELLIEQYENDQAAEADWAFECLRDRGL